MRFTVRSPAKVDVLFVVDNSSSMKDEQEALTASVNSLLQGLKSQNTSYRVGLVSTDAVGFDTACDGTTSMSTLMSPVQGSTFAARGPCGGSVVLRRPHDGARGRLMAAYDAAAFNVASFTSLTDTQKTALAQMFPTSAAEVRWVLDREEILQNACQACACETCTQDAACFTGCADPVADAFFAAHFKSNMQGFGTGGLGWEQGIASALWAVGVDAQEPNDTQAVQVKGSLLEQGMPNAFQNTSWVRDDAALAVMFLSDEEDCSMPRDLFGNVSLFEGDQGQPSGSLCYQVQTRDKMLGLKRMARLLAARKQGVANRVVVGFIGGVKKGSEASQAVPSDCVGAEPRSALPNQACSCFYDEASSARLDAWCAFSVLHDTSLSVPACQALAGHRYVDFAYAFPRRTFESICKNDDSYFGEALAEFGRLATFPCFDLNAVGPAELSSDAFEVRYTNKAQPEVVRVLPRTSVMSNEQGFFYDKEGNRVCLTGMQRNIGDMFDIFMFVHNEVSFKG